MTLFLEFLSRLCVLIGVLGFLASLIIMMVYFFLATKIKNRALDLARTGDLDAVDPVREQLQAQASSAKYLFTRGLAISVPIALIGVIIDILC